VVAFVRLIEYGANILLQVRLFSFARHYQANLGTESLLWPQKGLGSFPIKIETQVQRVC